MTAVEEERRLYHSPIGLYDFQAEGVARGYLKLLEQQIPPAYIWDTGIGKSHIAMALMAMGFEDRMWDCVLLVCEGNKVRPDEWPQDLDTYTTFDWLLYHGKPPKQREKIRSALPQVVLSTYETIKADCAKKIKTTNSKGREVEKIVPGPLTEQLVVQGRRTLIVYDEMTKLGNRKSGLYKHHEQMISALRKANLLAGIVCLTATPIERGPENWFNLGRLMVPQWMPTVAKFEENYVRGKDIYGNYESFKNLTDDDKYRDPDVAPFCDLMRPVLLRKRKTDPDVIDQFPQVMEEPPMYVRLGDKHQEFYEAVREVYEGCDEWTEKALVTVMRQIAGHPLALTLSKGKVAQAIVAEVGEAGLRALGAAKADRLIMRLLPIVKGQGAQVVVFTFFKSIIPFVQEMLEDAKLTVAPFHGGMSEKARDASKQDWKRGRYEVLLSSDSGARGINLPQAQYGFEYEMALTRANQIQRFNRIHRIDSKHASCTFQSLIAFDTVEDGIANGVMKRNDWQDRLLELDDPGEDFITAAQRKRLLKIARKAAA